MADPRPASAAAVVLAAGSGSRVGAGINKVLLPLETRPLVAWSVGAALGSPGVDQVLVVTQPGEETEVRVALGELGADPRVAFTSGGASRHASEWRALQHLSSAIDSGQVDVVAVHDAARPRASAALFGQIIAAARQYGGAVPVLPRHDLVARDGGDLPAGLVTVQTPQGFSATALLDAYRRAERDGFDGTDTAASIERYAADRVRIAAVPGEPDNLKVTFAGDLDSPE